MRTTFSIILSLALLTFSFANQAATIEVQVDKPGHKIPPTLWGIFFEDINCSADGGIYAELVRNRSFEDSDKPEHWSLVKTGSAQGEISVSVEQPMGGDLLSTRNRRSLKLRITRAGGEESVGAANDGYWGMSVRQGSIYNFSLFARSGDGFNGPLAVALQTSDGKVLATQTITGLSGNWKLFKGTLRSTGTDPKARLVISAAEKGTVWLDMVSLLPQNSWKGTGLRPDLMEKLSALNPAFMRFPGGCWVEGDTMKDAYRWKDTVGDMATRRTQKNIWQYWASHGIGFHEYLQMSQDLGAEPLFVINVGMSHKENVPMDQLAPYVQDAIDAIEYCNSPVTSQYGALRARNGHPAPFNLKYMEIGNENGGPAYNERWAAFHDAIKEKYPEIVLIANHWMGTYPRNVLPEIVDEHYYDSPEFFMAHANQYDLYDRDGPGIYVGEYAVTHSCGQGNLRAAIGEAAFMTGLERNSDIVRMASYAPLLANVNYKKWNPDLICYDSSRAYAIPSYYVQQMFAQNRGDVVLPVKADSTKFQLGSNGGRVGVGTWKTRAEFKDIKVTQGDKTIFASDFSVDSKGWKQLGDGDWKVVDGVLSQSSLAENVRAIAGDKSWKDYTLSLKARKLGGEEGFLILFNVQNENTKSWWNIGGWGNTRHGLELGGINSFDIGGSIETGRWYDIRIETSAVGASCYLDNKLIHNARFPELTGLYASATYDNSTGEIIVKVVNAAQQALETDVQFTGTKALARSARAIVLASANGEDENSLDEPEKVVPASREFELDNSSIHQSFPANSLTVIRVKENKPSTQAGTAVSGGH